jgi:hypothetical protein
MVSADGLIRPKARQAPRGIPLRGSAGMSRNHQATGTALSQNDAQPEHGCVAHQAITAILATMMLELRAVARPWSILASRTGNGWACRLLTSPRLYRRAGRSTLVDVCKWQILLQNAFRRRIDNPHSRTVSSWTLSTMRLMLFFEGRYPRYAFPVLAEYIRPNV